MLEHKFKNRGKKEKVEDRLTRDASARQNRHQFEAQGGSKSKGQRASSHHINDIDVVYGK